MSTILIILVLILLLGGGGYYGHSMYGAPGLGGVLGLVLIVVLVLWQGTRQEAQKRRALGARGAPAAEREARRPESPLIDKLAAMSGATRRGSGLNVCMQQQARKGPGANRGMAPCP